MEYADGLNHIISTAESGGGGGGKSAVQKKLSLMIMKANPEKKAKIALEKLLKKFITNRPLLSVEEASCFLSGDGGIRSLGVIQVVGQVKRHPILAKMALKFLYEVLLAEETFSHPSKQTVFECFVRVGIDKLAMELCLDKHAMEESTRDYALQLAFGICGNKKKSAELIFQNNLAALDLYKVYLEEEWEEEEEEDAVPAAANVAGDDYYEREARSMSNVSKINNKNASLLLSSGAPPKTWEEVGMVSIEDELSNNNKSSSSSSSTTTTTSSTVKMSMSAFSQLEADATKVAHYKRQLIQDIDPLGLLNSREKNELKNNFSTSLLQSNGSDKSVVILTTLYKGFTREELQKGLLYLEKEKTAKEVLKSRMARDRLNEIVNCRDAVDSLADINSKGNQIFKRVDSIMKASNLLTQAVFVPIIGKKQRFDDLSNSFHSLKRFESLLRIHQELKALMVMTTTTTDRNEFLKITEFVCKHCVPNLKVLDEIVANQRHPFRNIATNLIALIREFVLLLISESSSATAALLVNNQNNNNNNNRFSTNNNEDNNEALQCLHMLKKALPPNYYSFLTANTINNNNAASSSSSSSSSRNKKIIDQMNLFFEKNLLNLNELSTKCRNLINELLREETTFVGGTSVNLINASLEGKFNFCNTCIEKYSFTAMDLSLELIEKYSSYEDFEIDNRLREILSFILFENAPPRIPVDLYSLVVAHKHAELIWGTSNNTISSSSSSSNNPMKKSSPSISNSSGITNTSPRDANNNNSNNVATHNNSSSLNASDVVSLISDVNTTRESVVGEVERIHSVVNGFLTPNKFVCEEMEKIIAGISSSSGFGGEGFLKPLVKNLCAQIVDNLLNILEVYSKNVHLMDLDVLLSHLAINHGKKKSNNDAAAASNNNNKAMEENAGEYFDFSQTTRKHVLEIPLLQICWELIDNSFGLIHILCGKNNKEFVLVNNTVVLSVQVEFQKAARYLGIILGRLAEQVRLRQGNMNGFLTLSRECDKIKTLIPTDEEIHQQINRLQPALATQYLKAASNSIMEVVNDIIIGPKDPITNLRTNRLLYFTASPSLKYAEKLAASSSTLLKRNGNSHSTTSKWFCVFASISTFVSECDHSIGEKYAGKLKLGLLKALGTHVLNCVQGQLFIINPDHAKELYFDLSVLLNLIVLKAGGNQQQECIESLKKSISLVDAACKWENEQEKLKYYHFIEDAVTTNKNLIFI